MASIDLVSIATPWGVGRCLSKKKKSVFDPLTALMRKKRDHGAQWVWLCSFSTAEKRHADGTFTSDVSSYLKDQAIKDFVARLKAGQVRRE